MNNKKKKYKKAKMANGGDLLGTVQGLAPLLNLAVPGLGTGVGMAAGMGQQAIANNQSPSTYQPLTPASNKYGLNEGGVIPSKTEIQEMLKSRGYYKGKIDGAIGPQSRAAIRQFQKDHGLKDDGIVGKNTLAALTATKSGVKEPMYQMQAESTRIAPIPLETLAQGPMFSQDELARRDSVGLENTNYNTKSGQALPQIDMLGLIGDCDTYDCTRYQTELSAYLSGMDPAQYQTQHNAWGDAWERNSYLKDFGGKSKDVNAFDSYKVGDVVSLKRSKFSGEDKPTQMANDPNNTRAAGNQHVGTVIGKNKNGVPMVAHNFHGKVYVEPVNDIKRAFKYEAIDVIEPSTKSSKFQQVVGKVRGAIKDKVGLKSGGLLDSIVFTKEELAQGGALDSIGQSSVEVRANNPNSTDSVELASAYVDNDEIISKMGDGSTYVFPDDKINPLTGNKYSEDAKKLAKSDAKAEQRSYDPEAKNTLKHNEQIRAKFASVNELENMAKQMGKSKLTKKNKLNRGGLYGDPPLDSIPVNPLYPNTDLPNMGSSNTQGATPLPGMSTAGPERGNIVASKLLSLFNPFVDNQGNVAATRPNAPAGNSPAPLVGTQQMNSLMATTGAQYPQTFVPTFTNPTGVNTPSAAPTVSAANLQALTPAQEALAQPGNSTPSSATRPRSNYTVPDFLQGDNQIRQFQQWYSNRPGANSVLKDDNLYGPRTDAAWQQSGQDYMNDQFDRGRLRVPMGTLDTRSGYSTDNPLSSLTAAPNALTSQNTPISTTPSTPADETLSADVLYPQDKLGVGLQLGALGLQGLMQLGGPEEEKMRQLSSPITRQQFDPRASLDASQTAFNSAANQARNTTSRASMMGNLQGLASNAGRQRAQVTDRYNQMNAQAQTQYETRVAQREAQNMRTKYAVDQMNAQNRAAHRTGLRTLGQSVSNLGQARVAQTENRKSVDLILQTFPMIREHFLAQMDAQKTS